MVHFMKKTTGVTVWGYLIIMFPASSHFVDIPNLTIRLPFAARKKRDTLYTTLNNSDSSIRAKHQFLPEFLR